MNALRPLIVATAVVLIATLTAPAAMVTAPPDAPDWWNTEGWPYWGYASSPDGLPVDPNNPQSYQSNFDEFAVTLTERVSIKPSDTGEGFLGKSYRFQLENGYREEYVKRFFFYAAGTGAGLLPEAIDAPATGVSDNNVVTTITSEDGFQANYVVNDGAWSVRYEGIARPQPDRVFFSFSVWGESMGLNTVKINRWAVGEYCVPEPSVAGLTAIVLVASFAVTAGSRRRR
ncbi:MAG: hypothetical protein AAF266_06775 [Planctomycetota bacterium]